MSNRPLKYLYVLPTLLGGGAERTSETSEAKLSELGLRRALDFDTTKSIRRYTEVLGAI